MEFIELLAVYLLSVFPIPFLKQQPPVSEPVSSSLASSASSESVKQRFPCDRSRSKSQELGSISDDNTGETAATCESIESPLSPVNETSINDSVSIKTNTVQHQFLLDMG
jgi:hypothetical protein